MSAPTGPDRGWLGRLGAAVPWDRVLLAALTAAVAGGGVEVANRGEVADARGQVEALERQREAMRRGWQALNEQRLRDAAQCRADLAELRDRNRDLLERVLSCGRGAAARSRD